MTEAARSSAGKRGKLAVQVVLGAVSGAAGMSAALWLLEGQELPDPGVSVIIAAGVAVIYLLMGLLVGVGALFPTLGTKLLNVHDREELLAERSMMLGGALGCGLLGLAFLALIFANSGAAPFAPPLAFWMFVGVLGVSSVVSWRQWPLYDELMRALIQESVALFGYVISTVLVLWCAASAAGMVVGPQPLDLLSLTLGGFLVATFVVIGRRGMMRLD